MKHKTMIYIAICVVLVLLSWSYLSPNSFTSNKTILNNSQELTLKIRTDKETFSLGEIVKLGTELTNINTTPTTIRYGTVENGYLQIFISKKGSSYDECNGPDWGRKEATFITLDAGKSYKSEVNLLWNQSSQYFQQNSEKRVQTSYAFPEPGVYFIKAIITSDIENSIKIESEPVQIVINEPVGDDLTVWNKIKANGEFAYFMQQADFMTSKIEERENLQKQVKEISTKYQNSILAGQMKTSLEKFQMTEAKRKELQKQIEKNKRQPQ